MPLRTLRPEAPELWWELEEIEVWHGRCGTDANGGSLLAEQRAALEEMDVTAGEERRLVLSLWAAMDGARAAAIRERLRPDE